MDSNCNEGDNTDHKSDFTRGGANISHLRRLSSSRKPAALFTPGLPLLSQAHPHPPHSPPRGRDKNPGVYHSPPFHISLGNSFDAITIIREVANASESKMLNRWRKELQSICLWNSQHTTADAGLNIIAQIIWSILDCLLFQGLAPIWEYLQTHSGG